MTVYNRYTVQILMNCDSADSAETQRKLRVNSARRLPLCRRLVSEQYLLMFGWTPIRELRRHTTSPGTKSRILLLKAEQCL